MPVINRIAAFAPEMTAWRHWLHRHPELEFDLPQTAAFVAGKLREFGVDEIHEGIATSGIVALIHGRGPGPVIGLRSDMDALPLAETTGKDWASENPGKMHACGHDGHMTMLLGAAKYLAETRNFAGSVALIFQPAEEEGGGGEVMVKAGIMERFGISQVYGMHNAPNLTLGAFETGPGPVMAAVDTAWVTVTGKGGHGATPEVCIDPVLSIVAMVQALQTIVSRNTSAIDQLVVSINEIHVGTANNVVPESGWFSATIRSFDPAVRDMVEDRFRTIVHGQAAAFGVSVDIRYERGYPPTVNTASNAAFAADVAREISGPDLVRDDVERDMGAEDFSYMLEARPGAFVFLGIGPGAGLHHPAYDFNDEAAPIGASYFARLVERALPAK
ncbi:M20 aminoacylase family protein [Paenirhodobacter populi]|uniref:M20 aminoacylase family protein n=1 Tax=Paenirhodobacter populi TaxID=2306993 RepID=UPI000FE2A235|nr:M20 aminoacylase family protein [Sinirhodobacter populi]RWR06025.1 amidohydrolase [Sinirhodobacter populi]